MKFTEFSSVQLFNRLVIFVLIHLLASTNCNGNGGTTSRTRIISAVWKEAKSTHRENITLNRYRNSCVIGQFVTLIEHFDQFSQKLN